MSRASLIYILVLLACVTGVSLIIERGMRLQPPPDVSGEWHVEADPRIVVPSNPVEIGRTVLVEQSGRYLRLKFEGGSHVDLKLASTSASTPAPRLHELRFDGPGWVLVTAAHGPGAPLTCNLLGDGGRSFVLTRPGAVAKAQVATPLPPMTQTAAADDPADDPPGLTPDAP